ncbi:hypothetical protein Tco_0246403 [Tanacetum coccineum]
MDLTLTHATRSKKEEFNLQNQLLWRFKEALYKNGLTTAAASHNFLWTGGMKVGQESAMRFGNEVCSLEVMGYRTMAELHDKSNGSLGWKIDNEWWFTCYGVSSLYTDLGDCAWSCEHCAAMFWYGERLKGYSKVQTVRYHKPEKREDVPYVIQKLGQHLIISTTLRAAAGAVKREDDQRLFHNAAMRKQRSDVSDRWAPTWISGPSFPSILTNKEGKVDGLCDGSIMARVRKLTGCPSNVFGDQVPNCDSKTDEAALVIFMRFFRGSKDLNVVEVSIHCNGQAEGYDGCLVYGRKRCVVLIMQWFHDECTSSSIKGISYSFVVTGRIYCLEASEMARTHLMTRASITGVASNIT